MAFRGFELLQDPNEDKAAVLKPKDFKRLLREAGYGRNGERNLAIIWMSFGSALRVTEIANLKIRDVVQQDGSVKANFKLPAAYAKNSRGRLVFMLEEAQRKAIANYLQWRVANKRRVCDSPDYLGLRSDSPLFLARGHTGFTFRVKTYTRADGTIAEYKVCSSMQQLISDIIKRIGVPGGSSHSGRRTFATRLADRGVDIQYIQYFLGHVVPQQSLTYIESNTPRLRNILKGAYGDCLLGETK